MPPPPRRLESVARPKQFRSEQTLFRILDAAEALIEEKSLADASIPEIVRRAGSSVGGFYARFRDKNELLRALEERFYQDVSMRLELVSQTERWINSRIEDAIQACIAELVSVARRRCNLIIAFVARAAQDEKFREDALRFRRKVSERMWVLVESSGIEVGHPDPELGVDLGVQFALSLVFQQLASGETHAGGRPITDAMLKREIQRNFMAYVGIVGTPPASLSTRNQSKPSKPSKA